MSQPIVTDCSRDEELVKEFGFNDARFHALKKDAARKNQTGKILFISLIIIKIKYL